MQALLYNESEAGGFPAILRQRGSHARVALRLIQLLGREVARNVIFGLVFRFEDAHGPGSVHGLPLL